MLELYQAEWCPYSHRVRQRLTELQLDFVAREVAAYPEDRAAMREAVGEDEIPVLVLEDGSSIQGTPKILRFLHDTYQEGPEAEKHREREREHER